MAHQVTVTPFGTKVPEYPALPQPKAGVDGHFSFISRVLEQEADSLDKLFPAAYIPTLWAAADTLKKSTKARNLEFAGH